MTPSLAATWFIAEVKPAETYSMAAVVFMLDEPGWTSSNTDWTFSTSDPAYSQFVFREATFRVDLSLHRGAVTVLGSEIPLSKSNVFVVRGVTATAAALIYQEKLDLSVPFDADPLRAVVAQSAALRRALGLK